jgi:hypothetical protein
MADSNKHCDWRGGIRAAARCVERKEALMYGLRGLGMYLPSQGHTHWGPGTSMIQRINWTTGQEYDFAKGFSYPPPGLSGLGHCCESCKHGGQCSSGLGLFDSGLDYSQWGWPEYAVIAVGGYMVLSTLFTTKRAVSKVRALPGERRKRKAAYYRKKAAALTAKK